MNRTDDETARNFQETLSSLPPEWPESLTSIIAQRVANTTTNNNNNDDDNDDDLQTRTTTTVVVVLDDDPTGTQTVHDIPVLTDWTSESLLRDEICRHHNSNAFYILTNSRSLNPRDARAVNSEIARKLLRAIETARNNDGIDNDDSSRGDAAERGKSNKKLSLISRSDSTLRGHFPLETDTLAKELAKHDQGVDGVVVVPFFLEGGRYTIDDVHYVAEEEEVVDDGGGGGRGGGGKKKLKKLVPAAQTPFAQDRAFGFTQSNLRAYVEEKSKGRIKREDVKSISIEDVRCGGPERVRGILSGLTDGAVCVVNAASLRDVEVFSLGLLDAEQKDGKQILVRSAASFVQARLGLSKRPVLGADVICGTDNASHGGLVLVGSYVPKTTKQLQCLLSTVHDLEKIELNVSDLIDPAKSSESILNEALSRVQGTISSGRTAVVYTSRMLISGETAEESLAIGNTVSEALVSIVAKLGVTPRFIVAKGGITSSDVATKGLGIRRAMVLGQAAPGVPVWQIGEDGKFPGRSYVVFPGNVGGDDELANLVWRLKNSEAVEKAVETE